MDSNWMVVFEALRKVYQEDAYSNMAINEAIIGHRGCRSSFVRNMAKGTLRDTILLDFFIDNLSKSGIKKIKTNSLIVLRMGIYAIRSMDSIPEHSAVNEAVVLAKKVARGQDGFINAVLRSFTRRRSELESKVLEEADLESRLSLQYAYDKKITEMFLSQYGEEAENIMKGLNEPPAIILRTNRLKTSRDELIKFLLDEGIEAEPDARSQLAIRAEGSGIVGSQLFKDGLYSIQNISSILAIEALAPTPGSKVLDMCAAPGGKSAMMAELMEDRGSIVSCDIHEHRLELIEATAKRIGTGIISTLLRNGTIYDMDFGENFDYVLADVPCSGLGVIASKPEIKMRAELDNQGELIEVQRAILENALRYVKPGGRVCYSTCTLNRNENERLVNSVLETYKNVQILEMKTIMPYNDSVGFYYSIIEKNTLL